MPAAGKEDGFSTSLLLLSANCPRQVATGPASDARQTAGSSRSRHQPQRSGISFARNASLPRVLDYYVPDNLIVGQKEIQAVDTSKVGKRGAVVIPAALRRRFGIEEGTLVVAEAAEDGVLIRPAVAVPVEIYSPERKARLLLENATDVEDYGRAAGVVREELGLDPDALGIEPPVRR